MHRLILMLLAILSTIGVSQELERHIFGTNGPGQQYGVHDIAIDGEIAYIVGDFTQVGASSTTAARINHHTNKVDTEFPRSNGDVYALISDGSGGYFIGGLFSEVDGIPHQNLARVSDNGTLDPTWEIGVLGGDIRGMVQAGGTLYIGGTFTTVGDSARQYLAAIDIQSALVLPWNPEPNQWIETLVASSDQLYVGGRFTYIASETHLFAASFYLTNNEIVSSWETHLDSWVEALALHEESLYIGGNFTACNEEQRNRIAAVNAETGLLENWQAGDGTASGGAVYSIAVHNNTVYAGGSFSMMGGETHEGLAAMDLANGSMLAWNPQADGIIEALAVIENTLYVGGRFTEVNGIARSRLASFDTNGGDLTEWDPVADDHVFSLSTDGDWLLAGGQFETIGGGIRNYAAAIDLTIGEMTEWNPNANDRIFAIAVGTNEIFLGGDFDEIGGQDRNSLAAVDKATGAATSWDAGISSSSNRISDLKISGTTLYAAGNSPGLAGFDTETALQTRFFDAPNSRPEIIELTSERIYIGGSFGSVGGEDRNMAAAYDKATGELLDWSPDSEIEGEVKSMVISNDAVYLCGSIYDSNNDPVNLVAVDRISGDLQNWFLLPNYWTYALQIASDTLFVGGEFTQIGGVERLGVAAIDLANGEVLDWRIDISEDDAAAGFVRSLLVRDSHLLVGGLFERIDGIPHYGFGSIYDPNIVTSVSPGKDAPAPIGFSLAQNYPNPFNPTTTIQYSLSKPAHVQLKVHDISGRLVEVLVHGYKTAGSYKVLWNATHLSSGVYIVQLSADQFRATQKAVLLK